MGARSGRTPGTLAVYAMGLGLLGLTIGLLLGLSKSSVVKDVLTALFALIAAGALFYVPLSLVRSGGETGAPGAGTPPIDLVPLRAAALAARDARAAADKSVSDARAALSAAEAEVPQDANRIAAAKAALSAAEAEADKRAGEVAIAEANLTAAETEFEAAAARTRAEAQDALRSSYLAAGLGLGAFSLGIIIAALYGSLIRTGGSVDDLSLHRNLAIPERFSPEESLNALLLDRLLGEIGISSEARAMVIARADACGPQTNQLRQLTGEAKELLKNVKIDDPQTPSAVGNLGNALLSLHQALEVKKARAEGKDPVSPAFVIRRGLQEAFDAYAGFVDVGRQWLTGRPDVAAALERWHAQAVAIMACENTTALYAEAVVQLNNLPSAAFKADSLGRPATGLERLD